MKVYIKKSILNLFTTIVEALNFLEIDGTDYPDILQDCEDALNLIQRLLENEQGEKEISSKLELLKRNFIEGCEKAGSWKVLCTHTSKISEEIVAISEGFRNIKEERIKILFLPYKYSMWDSMESIWEAAIQDEEIECHILPIPYYDKVEMSVTTFHWERNCFPMETKDYRLYNIEKEKPDAIIIHNPYDEANTVTTILPEFYAPRLKKHTNLLVYTPYQIPGCKEKNSVGYPAIGLMPGIRNADMIILQSQTLKEDFIQNGVPERKIYLLGNPKIDAVIKSSRPIEIPEEWIEKRNEKKVILLNTTLGSFLNNERWLEYVWEKIIVPVINFPDILLIWRPHPLLEATIRSMFPERIEEYNQIINNIAENKNIILDQSEDALSAITFSHGLISDYSSIIQQYIFTEKPILTLFNATEKEWTAFTDFFACYSIYDGTTVEEFVEMILKEEDTRKEERVQRARNSVINTDGTCGEKVFLAIKSKIIGEEV